VLLLAWSVNVGCQCGTKIINEEIEIIAENSGEQFISIDSLEITQEPKSEENLSVDNYEITSDASVSENIQEYSLIPDQNIQELDLQEIPSDFGFQGPRYHFRVRSKLEDTVPPKLIEVRIQPQKIKAGNTFEISISVGTDLSDVTNAQVTLSSPNNIHSLYVDTTYHPSRKLFIATPRIPIYAEGGIWSISRLNLMDGARLPSVYLGTQPPLQGVSLEVVSEQEDIKPPTLKKIALAKDKLKAGEDLDFWVEAEDPGFGISSVEAYAQPTQGGQRIVGRTLYDPIKQRYFGFFAIPPDTKEEKWIVSGVDLADLAENRAFIGGQDPLIQDLKFEVIVSNNGQQPNIDTKPPEIMSAWLEPLDVEDGEPIRLYVDVNDDLSGVRWVRTAVADPKGQIKFQFDLQFNAATGLWEGTGAVPAFSSSGIWRIKYIEAIDRAGNVHKLEDDTLMQLPFLSMERMKQQVEHLSVIVSAHSQTQDREQPEIKGFNLAPGVVKAGSGVRVYTRLEDPGGSGVASASCTFRGPDVNWRKQTILTYNSDTGFFEGNLMFESSDPAGYWWVSGCFLQDRNGNTRSVAGWMLEKLPKLDISRATSKASSDRFVVEVKDTIATPSKPNPPIMLGFHLSPGVITGSGSIRFFAKLESKSNSDTQSGICEFRAVRTRLDYTEQIGRLSAQLKFNPATTLWEAEIAIPKEAVRGLWWIQECIWQDNFGNQFTLRNSALTSLPALKLTDISVPLANDHREFELLDTQGSPDQTVPKLHAVNIAPQKREAGQSVRVFVKADDNDKITSAFCSLKPPAVEPPFSAYGAAHLLWNPQNDLWEGNFQISSKAYTGVWSIAGCQLLDATGNRFKADAEYIHKITKLDISSILQIKMSKQTEFQVLNTGSLKLNGPVATEIKWLPEAKVQADHSIALQINAAPNDFNILRVEGRLESSLKKQSRYVVLQPNSATQLWETVVHFPKDSENGKWNIIRLELYDLGGNIQTYQADHPMLAKAELQVFGGVPSSDVTPPSVKKIISSQAAVLAGDPVRWSAEIVDDLIGVQSASIELVSPQKKIRSFATLTWNPATEFWEGEMLIPLYAEDGVWKVSSFSAIDYAGNTVTLDAQHSVLQNISIAVRGTRPQIDTQPPTVQLISIVPTKVSPSEHIRVIVEAQDDISGIADISVQIHSPKSERILFLNLQHNPATNRYESTLSIPINVPSGVWNIHQIAIRDQAGNSRIISKGDPFLP
jgi:hypothetical protein